MTVLGVRINGYQSFDGMQGKSQTKGFRNGFDRNERTVQHRELNNLYGCASAQNGGLEIGVSASVPGNERGFLLLEAADVG